MPSDPSIVDEITLSEVEDIAAAKARCDYAIMLGASQHNAKIIPQVFILNKITPTQFTIQDQLRHLGLLSLNL